MASRGGERSLSGYEMYRLSLLKHLSRAEYADASSDDLSSDWEDRDDAAGRVKKAVSSAVGRSLAPLPIPAGIGDFQALWHTSVESATLASETGPSDELGSLAKWPTFLEDGPFGSEARCTSLPSRGRTSL